MAGSDGTPVRLLVCTGGDCRRDAGFDKVLLVARATEGATSVPCQGVCKGPVVGVERNGSLRWYAKVRGDRRRALARLVRTGRGRSALRGAEIRSRRDKLKRPAKRRPL